MTKREYAARVETLTARIQMGANRDSAEDMRLLGRAEGLRFVRRYISDTAEREIIVADLEDICEYLGRKGAAETTVGA